jgi:hypothetical protein
VRNIPLIGLDIPRALWQNVGVRLDKPQKAGDKMQKVLTNPVREGKFRHWIEVTDVFRANAAYGEPRRSPALGWLDGSQIVVIEVCRTYPAPARIVKVIATADTIDDANLIGKGAAMTYGAKFVPAPTHDRATCPHEDCRWARLSEYDRRNLEAFGRDADRIDASPGRYW